MKDSLINSINSKINVLIMAGGNGTRFWPESIREKPKQYLSLVSSATSAKSGTLGTTTSIADNNEEEGNGDNLLRQTLKRFDNFVPINHRYIVTLKQQKENVENCIENQAKLENVIFEPDGRNTAPCILLSLATMLKNGASKDDICLVVPSDHIILNKTGFQNTIKVASEFAAKNDSIITIGINPSFPNTGFGYIQKGDNIFIKDCNDHNDNIYDVKSFKEKPDFNTAKEYLSTGQYYWNAGMFLGKIGTFLEEFKKHAKEIYCYMDQLTDSLDNFEQLKSIYSKIPKDSIDYAIMEKSKVVKVIPANFDWNDLGSWDALESVITKKNDNTIVNFNDCYIENSKGNIIYSKNQFISLIDVNDLVIVSNDKNLMILPKNQSQKVKNIVDFLTINDKKELL